MISLVTVTSSDCLFFKMAKVKHKFMLNVIVVQVSYVSVNHPCTLDRPSSLKMGFNLLIFKDSIPEICKAEKNKDIRRSCESSRNPWRGCCERCSLKIDLRLAPCCLLLSGKLAIYVNQGTICLRQFPFCRLFSSRAHAGTQILTPAGGPATAVRQQCRILS